MSAKRRGLGKGVDALFSAGEDEPAEASEDPGLASSKLEDKSSKLEVLSSESELEDRGSKLKVESSELEVKSSKLEGTSYNHDTMKIAIREADKNPRITLWSPVSSAMLKYLRKTIPEFSISEEASQLLEEAIVRKYPGIYEGIKKEKEGGR
ncbi:MAG: hypothetical protein AB7V64_11015 [Methanothrix sp.]